MTTHVVSGLEGMGQRLREERERLGMSQGKLAEIGGVARNSQVNYETGKRACDAAYLAGVCAAGLDIGFVVSGERSAVGLSDQEAQLLGYLRQLDPEERAALIRIARSMAGDRNPSRRIHDPVLAYKAEPPASGD